MKIDKHILMPKLMLILMKIFSETDQFHYKPILTTNKIRRKKYRT